MTMGIENKNIGVVGSGSFGTAMVKMLLENAATVNWCVRDETLKNHIKQEKRNPNYLSSVAFDVERLNLTTSIDQLVHQSDIIIFVVPSIYLLETLKPLTISLENKIIITAIKGLIPQSCEIIGDYFMKEYGVAEENIGVIAGPCHAEEIALERLSYITLAFKNEENLNRCRRHLKSDFVRVTPSDDIYGTEHSAVLKNVYAISAGIANGLNYGDNFIAVLLSNAIREMEEYLKIISPIDRNINNSVYLGDLLVTGYSYFSRNRMFGNMIGKGYTVKSALMEMNMVPEGYYATEGIFKISEENGLNLPILETVHKILYQEKNPRKQFKKLTKKID